MKITFLGTNGWYSTEVGNAICTLVETEKYYVIFDAGEGFHRAAEYITKDLPVYLFLSHLHMDHIYGLHILPRMRFRERLKIIVPEIRLAELRTITKTPFMAPMKDEIISVGVGEINQLPFPAECQRLQHQDEAFGYRIELDGKTLAYCLDTAYCEAAIALAKNSDVLFHECTNRPGQVDGGWGHSNPEEAAEVAQQSGAKKLILTHFMPDYYPDSKSREDAQSAARKIFNDSIAARDGMTIEI